MSPSEYPSYYIYNTASTEQEQHQRQTENIAVYEQWWLYAMVVFIIALCFVGIYLYRHYKNPPLLNTNQIQPENKSNDDNKDIIYYDHDSCDSSKLYDAK